MLAAAIALAGLAAMASWSYLNGADQRAYANASLVKVFRVDKDVPKGLPGEQALDKSFIRSDVIPQRFRPGTALTDINAVRGKVALSNMSAGQILVDGQFVDPKVATVSFAQRIPAGQVAVTVQVDQVHGVANLIVPGDKVNLLTSSPEGQRTLYQSVNVLAVGTTPAAQAGDTQAQTAPQGSGLITFAVPPLAAEKIALAAGGKDSSGLYLTLVPPDNQPVPVPPANPANLFQGGLTPYGP